MWWWQKYLDNKTRLSPYRYPCKCGNKELKILTVIEQEFNSEPCSECTEEQRKEFVSEYSTQTIIILKCEECDAEYTVTKK